MEAGKKRLNGDTVREANTDEVDELRNQNNALKIAGARLLPKYSPQKKGVFTFVKTPFAPPLGLEPRTL